MRILIILILFYSLIPQRERFEDSVYFLTFIDNIRYRKSRIARIENSTSN